MDQIPSNCLILCYNNFSFEVKVISWLLCTRLKLYWSKSIYWWKTCFCIQFLCDFSSFLNDFKMFNERLFVYIDESFFKKKNVYYNLIIMLSKCICIDRAIYVWKIKCEACARIFFIHLNSSVMWYFRPWKKRDKYVLSIKVWENKI